MKDATITWHAPASLPPTGRVLIAWRNDTVREVLAQNIGTKTRPDVLAWARMPEHPRYSTDGRVLEEQGTIDDAPTLIEAATEAGKAPFSDAEKDRLALLLDSPPLKIDNSTAETIAPTGGPRVAYSLNQCPACASVQVAVGKRASGVYDVECEPCGFRGMGTSEVLEAVKFWNSVRKVAL